MLALTREGDGKGNELCTFSHSSIEFFFTILLLKNSQRAILQTSSKDQLISERGFQG